MVSSKQLGFKLLKMAIQFEYLFSDEKAKMANVMLQILDGFSLV